MNSKDLENYIQPSITGLLGYVLYLVVGIIVTFIGIESSGLAIIGLIIAIVNGVILYVEIKKRKELTTKIETLNQQGYMDFVLKEFEEASSFLGNNLRLGERNIFGKHSGIILGYNSIKKIYQKIYKVNFAERKRSLCVETVDDKTYEIGKLKLEGKSDNELKEIMIFFLSKNKNIVIGH